MKRIYHETYVDENPTMKAHVDNMFDLVNAYAKENGIPLAYDDRAEEFVEAIASYIEDSKN